MNLSFSVTETLNDNFQKVYRENVVKILQGGGAVMSQSAFFEMLLNFWVDEHDEIKAKSPETIEKITKALNDKEIL